MKPSQYWTDDFKLFSCIALSTCWIITCRWRDKYDNGQALLLRQPLTSRKALCKTRQLWHQQEACRFVSCFCVLSTLPPACFLTERFDECCRRVELAAVFTPLPSITTSIFSFHSPAPLLLSHTSLPLSFFEPTNLLLCGFLSSSLTFFFNLISILPSPNNSVSQHKGPSHCCSMRVCMRKGPMISQCTATGGSTGLFIRCHLSIMKR